MIVRFLPLAMFPLIIATAATAGEAQRVTARVSIDGIDFAAAGHQNELDRRVATAARRACMDRTAAVPRMTPGARQCVTQMLADGRIQARRMAARANGQRAVAVR